MDGCLEGVLVQARLQECVCVVSLCACVYVCVRPVLSASAVFSLAGCSDWLALGKGDIMFSPKPTCIPHPPFTAAAIVSEGVCACVRERKQERVSEGGLCFQAITHSALSAKVLLVFLAEADEV